MDRQKQLNCIMGFGIAGAYTKSYFAQSLAAVRLNLSCFTNYTKGTVAQMVFCAFHSIYKEDLL